MTVIASIVSWFVGSSTGRIVGIALIVGLVILTYKVRLGYWQGRAEKAEWSAVVEKTGKKQAEVEIKHAPDIKRMDEISKKRQPRGAKSAPSATGKAKAPADPAAEADARTVADTINRLWGAGRDHR